MLHFPANRPDRARTPRHLPRWPLAHAPAGRVASHAVTFAFGAGSAVLLSRAFADTTPGQHAQALAALAALVALAALLAVGLLGARLLRRLRRATERATRGETTVREFFASHTQPMWVFDARTLAFLTVNAAAEQHYGYTADEFRRMTLKDIRPDEDVPSLMSLLAEPLQAQRDAGILRHRRKSGDLIHVHSTLHPIQYEGRDAVLVVVDDVTAQVLGWHTAERQEARYRQLHESLQQVLWLADADGTHLYVSPAFERVYGRPVSSVTDDVSVWMDAIAEEDWPVAQASYATLAEHGVSHCEYRIRRPDGELRWVSDRKQHILDADGETRMIGGCIEDITERRNAERTLREAHDTLEARVKERTSELQALNRELDAFARTAAHDLRAPLNAIGGFVQLLQLKYDQVLGEDGQRMTRHIEEAVRAMSRLVGDLLALSQVTTHALELVPVDLAAIARTVLADLARQDPQRDVALVLPDALTVQADAGLMRSLLANLLGNAWKYSAREPHATIELGSAISADGSPVVFVRDNGAGFDPAQMDRLFQPFQRLHAASEFAGNGVGLATCQRIVLRHGGQIWAQSAVGAGACFFFTLGMPPA